MKREDVLIVLLIVLFVGSAFVLTYCPQREPEKEPTPKPAYEPRRYKYDPSTGS